jgi:putative ABC transport system permease protein
LISKTKTNTMLKNYFIIAIRNLVRQKWATLISIVGLSTAMALFSVIMLYVWYERSYDSFHEKIDNIYFVEGEKWTNTPAPLANVVLDEFPEVENVVRIDVFRNFFWVGEKGDNLTRFSNVLTADSSIFNVFSFNIVQGDKHNPFPTWNSMAISRSSAKVFFGNTDPIGKTLVLNSTLNYTITVVYDDLPKNSSLNASAVIPFYGLDNITGDREILKNWSNWNYHTWILLRENSNSDSLSKNLGTRLHKLFTEDLGWTTEGSQLVKMRPLKGMYLDGKPNDLKKGNKMLLIVLSAVAFFILLIACINFVNLSTAKAIRRAKEVGLRKTVGASRSILVSQFMVEAFLLTLISLLLSIGLTEVILPEFNSMVVSELTILQFGVTKYLTVIFFTLIGVTLMAGLYPALFLTSYSPVKILKGEVTRGNKGSKIRKGLVVVQFTIAIVLAICSIVVYQQMQYLKNYDIGINKEQIVFFNRLGHKKNLLRERLMGIVGVEKVSFTTGVPGGIGMSWGRVVDEKYINFSAVIADPEYLEILGVEFVEGRNFSYNFSSDSLGAVIFNETAIRNFEIENPLEKTMGSSEGPQAPIIGVFKNFHFKSLHHELEPLGIFMGEIDWAPTCMMKVNGNVPEIMKQVEQIMSELSPGIPFSFRYLDDHLASSYKKEERLAKSFMYFTIIAILIACLGLFAMASYAAEQRVKEIGIRKVLGANVSEIIWIMSRDFGALVVISNIIAWPIAYFAMNRWLQHFPQRISPEILVFVLVAIASLVIMQLTILYKSISASRINPATTLKYE